MAFKKKTDSLAKLRSADSLTRYGITLLQQERAAILSGSFEELAELANRKTALLDEIESRAEAVAPDQTNRERMEQRQSLMGVASILSRRASENQNLLSSAVDGARKATEMIERLNGGGSAGFYGATGHRISTSNQGAAVLKI